MLADDDPAVLKELERRQAVRAKVDQSHSTTTKDDKGERSQKREKDKDKVVAEEKDSSKWQSTHQELAEKRAQTDFNIPYPYMLCL